MFKLPIFNITNKVINLGHYQTHLLRFFSDRYKLISYVLLVNGLQLIKISGT